MYEYMLLVFDVRIIYTLDVIKCIRLVNGGTGSHFKKIQYRAIISSLLDISEIKNISIVQ